MLANPLPHPRTRCLTRLLANRRVSGLACHGALGRLAPIRPHLACSPDSRHRLSRSLADRRVLGLRGLVFFYAVFEGLDRGNAYLLDHIVLHQQNFHLVIVDLGVGADGRDIL